MKIVEAITDTNVGGAGILLITRLRNSEKTNASYHVLLPKGSALRERLREIEGVTVWELSVKGDRSFCVGAVWRYISLLQYLKPDLVNCHGALSCRIAAMLCRVPCRIYTRHCAYPPKAWQRTFPGKWVLGRAQRALSSYTVAVADAARENLTQMGSDPARIRVIINGVEALPRLSETEKNALRRRLRVPDRAFVVGICARLEPCKDHECFLRAAERLARGDSRYYFLIVGDGSRAEALMERCRLSGIGERVRFTGFVDDVSPYFNMMDINVNCSVGTETSSLALSEGMSLGIPAVVSDYGGNPYMVRHGENGLVYPRGDDRALADAIDRLARDPSTYQTLSEGALRRFCEELNASHMTKETEQLYWELFGSVKDREADLPRRNRSKARSRRRSS